MTQTPQLRALGAALGTEALGIDLSKPLEADTFAWIGAAFAEHPPTISPPTAPGNISCPPTTRARTRQCIRSEATVR